MVANGGLRSDGADGEIPIQERVLYPAHRSPFYGPGFSSTRPTFLHLGRGPSVAAPSRLRNSNFGALLQAVQLGEKSHKDVRHLCSYAPIVTYPQTVTQAVDNFGQSGTRCCVRMKGRNPVPSKGFQGKGEGGVGTCSRTYVYLSKGSEQAMSHAAKLLSPLRSTSPALIHR